ncbi:hypothetical protein IM660_11320 [Ruania alkalisoli]|uniref:ABC3 transporter permease C-terminal domain-containing protein n=1 Tax=Ruania alkalisoli TaxID=2779775 RepID=A0A7M1SQM1_9MICO|nr:FtsX-like permease family protein [Ruania alkalisoli]QOR69294.1 hypothetical protein IM660_11320 [Ruania alkalisoli]
MGAWVARWRAALRIARRDAWRNKGRTVLVVLLMMLPVAAGTFAIGALKSSRPTAETQITAAMGTQAQAQLEVACRGARAPTEQQINGGGVCFPDGPDLGELTEAELVAALPDGDGVVVGFLAATGLRTDEVLVDSVGTVEVDAAQVPGLVGDVDGDAMPGRAEILLGPGVAERLSASLGDAIELVTYEGSVVDVEVVGIGDRGPRVVVGPGTLPDGYGSRTWFVTGDAPVTWADVVALNEIGVTAISRAVLTDPPPPEDVYGGQFQPPADNAMRVGGAVLAVVALGLLEVVLLVGPAFAVGAKRSARTLALIAASGGQPRDLRRIVLAGGVVAGVLAAVVGVAVGTGCALAAYEILERSGEPVPNVVVPVLEPMVIGVIAVLLGLAAAWLPARAASRADVVTVLAGRRAFPPTRRRRGWIWLGLAAAGMGAAVIGAITSWTILLVVGVVTFEIGLIVASGTLVGVGARIAPRFGIAGRFALRDAHRNRSRTAPAVAAVLVAVAAASAGLVWTASSAEAERQMWRPVAADGTGVLGLHGDTTGGDRAEQFDQATGAVTELLPDAAVTPVRKLRRDVTQETSVRLMAIENPDVACPGGQEVWPGADDDRCRSDPSMYTGISLPDGVLVDDGSLVSLMGLEGADAAAAALAAGEVLVSSPDDIWADGQARLQLMDQAADTFGAEVAVPAHVVNWGKAEFALVIPPDVADQFVEIAVEAPGPDGEAEGPSVSVEVVGALVTGAEISQGDIDRLNRQLSEMGEGVTFAVEGNQSGPDVSSTLLLLVAAAVVVAIAATALSVGLALADSRPDLATLAAVGASPRVRRRMTAAQAGVIAGIGTVVGVVSGVALGFVFTTWQQGDVYTGTYWETVVPWEYLVLLLVALPALAIIGGWLFTRSRLPAIRRAAS